MEDLSNTILEGLDESQRLAATTLHGPVRIIAGAGAGKTRTVTRRIAYGCATGQFDPVRVLAVTFSVKAAAQMRSRLDALGVAHGVRAATFHSEALRQLRASWAIISDSPFPHVVSDVGAIMQQVVNRFDDHDRFGDGDIRDIVAEINWAKVSLVAPEDYQRVCSAYHRVPPAGLSPGRFADIYVAYEQEKSARGEMDFNDILLMDCHVLTDFPEAAGPIRSAVGHLTVDEYQDVSALQHLLMTLWLDGNRDICVVGDPAQTIYSFAGANSYYLLRFDEEFAPLCANVELGRDYRSTPQVVAIANTVLSHSPMRADYLRLSAVRDDGVRVERRVYDNDDEEARAVASRIVKLIRQGADISDCAVLTRVNSQHAKVCRALRAEGLRYRLRRDAGLGAVGGVLEDTNESRREALEALGLRAAGAVSVSTIHASKGLEFKHVFLIGCSEGLIPFGSPGPGNVLEEERRLLYVGVTRAEDTLHISYARAQDETRSFRRSPSRFL